MSNPYKITSDDKFTGLTVIIGGEPYTVEESHTAYEEILAHVIGKVDDDDVLLRMIVPIDGIKSTLTPLTERLTYRSGAIYLDGDPLASALSEYLARLITDGAPSEDYMAYANFIEKLVTNPSKQSRKHLEKFIETHQITLLPNGNMLLYKGVTFAGFSIHAGYGIVDGVVYEDEQLPNEVGSVVEMPRSMVDNERDRTCSVGLHVGAYSYASTFGNRMIHVSVNPRDVVSVPSDYNNAKIRVSRYTVLDASAEESKPEVSTPVFVPADEHYPTADDDETELSDKEIRENAKIEEFIEIIHDLPENKIRWYRNKRITAKNRPLFDRAIAKVAQEGE